MKASFSSCFYCTVIIIIKFQKFTFLVRENREFFTKKNNMKIELSEYFKYDFKCGYLFVNNKGRRVVELVHRNSTKSNPIKRFISYAKYLWISNNKREVPEGYEVDHIDGDKTNDNIENLQVITGRENRIKAFEDNDRMGITVVRLRCPVCGKIFIRRLAFIKPDIKHAACCSHTCSGKYQSIGHYSFNSNKYLSYCKLNSYKIDPAEYRKLKSVK